MIWKKYESLVLDELSADWDNTVSEAMKTQEEIARLVQLRDKLNERAKVLDGLKTKLIVAMRHRETKGGDKQDFIEFTPEKIKEFRLAYEKASGDKAEAFTFDDRKVLTLYAKYVLQYLDKVS